MYWWNYKKLAEALRNGTVKPWQLKVYWAVFLSALLAVVAIYCFLPIPSKTTLDVINSYIATIVYTIVWITLTYRINQSGDNRDYLKRVVCLSFPLSIRFILIIFPFIMIAGLISFGLQIALACPEMQDETLWEACVEKAEIGTTTLDLAVNIISMLVGLHWSRQSFLYVSGKKTL